LLKRGRAGQAIAMVVGITVLVAVVAPTASMAAAKTKRVSVKTNGTLANSDSAWSAISANGRFIAFQSEADNLVGNGGRHRAEGAAIQVDASVERRNSVS
jgi:hypothetical protein